MNALGSIEYDPSVTPALSFAASPLTGWAEAAGAVCCHIDRLPCAPDILAERILSPVERAYWLSLHAIEKRRREWLLGRYAAKEAVRTLLAQRRNLNLAAAEIEIVPDGYGCPRVSGAAIPEPVPVISIAHSEGAACAAAALGAGVLLGIDLESLQRRRENFEAIAFGPGERILLANLPAAQRQEWALRMWGAKEALGKALGRGLSAGLHAFEITKLNAAAGSMELRLGDAAIAQAPSLAGKWFTVYTARDSNFVFSAMIYQQGAVRMRPSRQDILDYLLQKMGELTEDWDYTDPVRPESLLFTELGFESLDAVVLCTAIQEHFKTPMPFAELLAEIGQQQRDLSINELTDFVDTHLAGSAAADSARRVQ